MIDHQTYESTIRRHWAQPGAHQAPNDCFADDYEAALASSEPIHTAPGDLEDTQRSAEGFPAALGIGVIVAVAVGMLLAWAWPAIISWGYR